LGIRWSTRYTKKSTQIEQIKFESRYKEPLLAQTIFGSGIIEYLKAATISK